MSPAIERDLLGELSNAVAAYLSTMAVTADCLEQSFPEVGGPYRKRVHSLLSRVSFDATREAIADSAQTLQDDLKDYATVAKQVRIKRSLELERGVLALSDIVENLTQRQEFYSSRLRKFAEQMEKAAYPSDAATYSEVMALQGAALRGLVENMHQETGSMAAKMREQMTELDQRLAGAASTDAVTGAINRQELERQIEAHTMHGATFSLLLFQLDGPISDEVLRMAAAKISTQFRHRDRVGRWGNKEFAVLFLGSNELAKSRAGQVASRISGRYLLDNGETVLIEAHARLLLPEFATL
jgi:GGDEF domain-containing protein